MARFVAALVLSVVVFFGGCSVGLAPQLLTSHVRQRTQVDCMVAALATMGRWTYEEVDRARMAVGIPIGDGLTANQLAVIAKQLGMELWYDSTPNPVQEDGIFAVRWGSPDGVEPTLHAVYLQDGWVYDPALDRPQPWVMWLKDGGPGTDFLYVLRTNARD